LKLIENNNRKTKYNLLGDDGNTDSKKMAIDDESRFEEAAIDEQKPRNTRIAISHNNNNNNIQRANDLNALSY